MNTDRLPYYHRPAAVHCCGQRDRVQAVCAGSSTPRQPYLTNRIAARGAGALPRYCDWSRGHPATRSRCPFLWIYRWKAWTSWTFGRKQRRGRTERKPDRRSMGGGKVQKQTYLDKQRSGRAVIILN